MALTMTEDDDRRVRLSAVIPEDSWFGIQRLKARRMCDEGRFVSAAEIIREAIEEKIGREGVPDDDGE